MQAAILYGQRGEDGRRSVAVPSSRKSSVLGEESLEARSNKWRRASRLQTRSASTLGNLREAINSLIAGLQARRSFAQPLLRLLRLLRCCACCACDRGRPSCRSSPPPEKGRCLSLPRFPFPFSYACT